MYKCIFVVICACLFFASATESTGTGKLENFKPTFSEGKLINDKEHMKRELEELIDIVMENMTMKKMEFYYFRIHDFDRNQHLDGNELFFALSEYLPLSEKMDQLDIETYYAKATDSLLAEADQNEDGMISWDEYVAKTRSYHDNQEKQ